jgi:hypothetical protein
MSLSSQEIYHMARSVGNTTFLVHTAQHTRPFVFLVPFVARDFAEWGHVVEHHASGSAYIKEVKLREAKHHLNNLTRKNRHETRRKKLLEIWGQEIIRRKAVDRERGSEELNEVPAATWGFEAQDKRLKKVGDMVQDFIAELVAFDKCGCDIPKHLLKPDVSHKDGDPIPPAPLRIMARYMHLLHVMIHTPNVPVPVWAHPNIHYADRVILEFYNYEAVKLNHLTHAMERALGKGEGRMGRTEKVKGTGVNRVLLYVDVGDCLVLEGGVEEETVDPVPLYERGEHPPVYVEVCG